MEHESDMSTPAAAPAATPSLLSAEGLWGDKKFADATVILGERTWKVHRWVVCRQSGLFMRELEGDKMKKDPDGKTVNIWTDNFTADEVQSMLRFLYHNNLTKAQEMDPLKTFLVAEFFEVETMRAAALYALQCGLVSLVITKYWRNLRKQALHILDNNPDTDAAKVLTRVVAAHAGMIINLGGGIWDDIVSAHPAFANDVIKYIFTSVPADQRYGFQIRGNASEERRNAAASNTATTSRFDRVGS